MDMNPSNRIGIHRLERSHEIIDYLKKKGSLRKERNPFRLDWNPLRYDRNP
jgi:hypothetical protein